MITEQIKATLKDIKVTNKGINFSFENVKFKEEKDLLKLSELIGSKVFIDVEAEQIDLFGPEEIEEMEDQEGEAEIEQESEEQESEEQESEQENNLLTDDQISEELGIEIESGQLWQQVNEDN